MSFDSFWKKMVYEHAKKLESISVIKHMNDSDYRLIKRVYGHEDMDSSWKSLSEGDPNEFKKLRKCCKVFLRRRKKRGVRPYGQEE
jgi:hypothetical protein